MLAICMHYCHFTGAAIRGDRHVELRVLRCQVTAVPIELSSSDDDDAAVDAEDSEAEQRAQQRKPTRGAKAVSC